MSDELIFPWIIPLALILPEAVTWVALLTLSCSVNIPLAPITLSVVRFPLALILPEDVMCPPIFIAPLALISPITWSSAAGVFVNTPNFDKEPLI